MQEPSTSTSKGKSASTRRRSKMKNYNSYLMSNRNDPFFAGLRSDSSDEDESQKSSVPLRTKRPRAHNLNPVHLPINNESCSNSESTAIVTEDLVDCDSQNVHQQFETEQYKGKTFEDERSNGEKNNENIGDASKTASDDSFEEDSGDRSGNKHHKNTGNNSRENEEENAGVTEEVSADESEEEITDQSEEESTDDIEEDSANESEEESEAEEDDNEIAIAEGNQVHDDNQRGEERNDCSENMNSRNRPFLNSALGDLLTPLRFKKHVTAKDNLLATIAMSIRYNTTFDMSLTMLKWIDTTTHDSNLPKSKKGLWSTLGRNDDAVKRHLYCSDCRDYIGQGRTIKRPCCCGACDPKRSENTKLAFFLEISLREQLTTLLSIPGIADELNYRDKRKKKNPDAIEDIYDAEEYIQLRQPGKFLNDPFNFTYKFYTDGACISKSSSASAWPIFIEINELHPHARKKHIMLAGIWVDSKHPIANTYMSPFVRQARELYEHGINWKPDEINEVTSKFMPVIFCADSGARWDFLGMSQFNGAFGCTFCYIRGIVMPGKSNQSKYSVEDNSRSRTDEEIRCHGKEALAANTRVYGVQGPSAFTKLPGFNMASGAIVDSMHNVYMGVDNQHTLLLLEDSGYPYYIGTPQQIDIINKRLKAIKMPSRVSRKARSLKFVKQFKATEWRNWGYYGLQCLEGVLPSKYHKHLALLFEAGYILNKDSVTLTDIEYADDLLSEYRRLFQKYFGLQRMTYNIHLLKHLCETVYNWGPFWVHSAFTFESMNEKIMDSVTSSTGPAWQIYTRFMMRKFINNSVYDPSVSAETKTFISEMLNIKTNHCGVDVDAENTIKFKGLGQQVKRPPHDWESRELQAAGYECVELVAYQKAQIGGIEYRCLDFKPHTKFRNSVVYCDNIGYGEILGIVSFYFDNQRIEGIFLRSFLEKGYAFGTKFITDVSITKSIIFVNTHCIRAPAFVVDTSGGLRAIRLPNVWESD